MSAIWKFDLVPNPEDGIAVVSMPAGSNVLTVQAQDNVPRVWVVVDPAAPTVQRRFQLIATGQTFDSKPSHKYVGTFQLYEGTYVFHLFEVI